MKNVTMFPLSIEERNESLQIYSDFHKDAYGFRPRYNYHSFSDEQLCADFDTFSNQFNENQKEEAVQLETDIEAWVELVDKTIHMGANTRANALRWIVESHNEWDAEHIVWSHGLLFSDKGRALVKEIEESCMDILNRQYNSYYTEEPEIDMEEVYLQQV